ncbi:MAG: class I SAM-dependent methyltransferase [Actinomycetota bacterium]
MPDDDPAVTQVDCGPFTLIMPGTDEPLPAGASPEADGVWRLVRPDRHAAVAEFAARYGAVREAEGLAPIAPDAVRALPFADLTGRHVARWTARAASYERLLAAADLGGAPDGGHRGPPPGLMVDIGAGSGWLAADLARRGWSAAAVDLCVNDGDGLRAAQAHPEPLTLIQAEMDALPFASASVDLAVFNAALHYAPAVDRALAEAARVLSPGGRLVVLDSPVFATPRAGAAMVADFAAHTARVHGVEAAPLEGPGFVTERDLDAFATSAGIPWRRIDADTGLVATLRAWRGRRRAGREIARMPLLMMTLDGRSG